MRKSGAKLCFGVATVLLAAVSAQAQRNTAPDGWQDIAAGDWQTIEGTWQLAEGQTVGLAWTETEEGVRAELPSDVLFDFDSASLRPEAEAALSELAEGIRARDPERVRIEGHTDAKGSDDYNQALSESRAMAVMHHLVAVEAIDDTLMISEGFGESRPIAPNTRPDGGDNPEGRQRNRRVEILMEGT